MILRRSSPHPESVTHAYQVTAAVQCFSFYPFTIKKNNIKVKTLAEWPDRILDIYYCYGSITSLKKLIIYIEMLSNVSREITQIKKN